jgi:hypothetical protein
MTCYRSVPKSVLAPSQAELRRQLLEQFYEDSMSRYGIDSDQFRTLSRQVHWLSRCLFPADSAEPSGRELEMT